MIQSCVDCLQDVTRKRYFRYNVCDTCKQKRQTTRRKLKKQYDQKN